MEYRFLAGVGAVMGQIIAGAINRLKDESRDDGEKVNVIINGPVISAGGASDAILKPGSVTEHPAGDRISVTLKKLQPNPKDPTKVVALPMKKETIRSAGSQLSKPILGHFCLISIMVTFFVAYWVH